MRVSRIHAANDQVPRSRVGEGLYSNSLSLSIYMYIYIYISICVYVCLCSQKLDHSHCGSRCHIARLCNNKDVETVRLKVWILQRVHKKFRIMFLKLGYLTSETYPTLQDSILRSCGLAGRSNGMETLSPKS